jgi:AcrR family transcriptional regulator
MARKSPTRTQEPDARVSRKAAGRKPSRKAEVTRLRILKAAAKIFAQHGYHLALLGNIAREAGIHVTALYYYFDTKEHLVEEMLNRFATATDTAVRASVQALPAGASYREKITAAAITQVSAMLSDTDFMTAHSRVLYQVPQDVRDRHFVYLRAGLFFWRALIKGAWDSGEIRRELDPSIATQILMGSLNWTPEWYHPGRKTPAEIARDAVDIMFDGMAARRPVKPVKSARSPATGKPARPAHQKP